MTACPTFTVVDDATASRASLPVLLPGLAFTDSYRSVEDLLAARPVTDVVVLDLHLANSGQREASQGIGAVRRVVEAGYRVCVFSQEERRFVLADHLSRYLQATSPGDIERALGLGPGDLLDVWPS